MIIIFGIVIFLAFIMESYVAVKMSERMDALEEANSSLQQQINDFYGDQPISLDTNSICSYFSGYISDIKKDSYNINVDLILRNYQDNTIAQVIFKTDKDTYTLSLNKEEDHFNGTINLPIQTLQSTQLISQTNGETNSEVLDIDVNFENYLDEDASGGIMLESYNEKKNKGDFTLSFSGNKTKKDEIYLWDKEYNFKRNTEYHDVKGTIYINSDKEYIEFVNLLKGYVDSKVPNNKVVNLVYVNSEAILLSSDGNLIELDLFDSKYLSDITFCNNDYVLNTLVGILPSKIILHLVSAKDVFIKTVELIFGDKVSVCPGCELCTAYKMLNLK